MTIPKDNLEEMIYKSEFTEEGDTFYLEDGDLVKCDPKEIHFENGTLRKLLYQDCGSSGWFDVSSFGLWVESSKLVPVEKEDENRLNHGKFLQEISWTFPNRVSISLFKYENILQVVFKWIDAFKNGQVESFYKRPLLYGSIKHEIEMYNPEMSLLLFIDKIEEIQ